MYKYSDSLKKQPSFKAGCYFLNIYLFTITETPWPPPIQSVANPVLESLECVRKTDI